MAAARSRPGPLPIHIHLAEQPREVHDCLERFGRRPWQLLTDAAEVDRSWCLVHGTHLTEEEIGEAAERQAVIGLCPSTEADLGDGIFPLGALLAAGGQYGIRLGQQHDHRCRRGLSAAGQSQRLAQLRRVTAVDKDTPHCGAALWHAALEGGARASGRPAGRIAPGFRADLVVLDPDHPSLFGRGGDRVLDLHLFAPGCAVRDVMVGGNWSLRAGHHAAEAAIARDYRRAITRLLA